MTVVVVHPTGNRNVRAVLHSLVENGALAEFGTTLAADVDAAWIRFLPAAVREEWLRRAYNIPANKIWTHGQLELARILLPKIGLSKYVRNEDSFASIDSVYKELDRAAAKRLIMLHKKAPVDAVYAYEDGALELFKQAKALGLTCIYDLPIAYWETGRKLMMEEAERLPRWANTLGGGIKDSEQKLERKTREMELADIVVGPGEFVMNSVPGWARQKKMIMSPFGSPETKHQGVKKEFKPGSRLRVLFVGSMGQRKGLGDLFAAIKLLARKDIELVVMGSLSESIEFYRKELPEFTYETGRPHHEVLGLMRSCDVFCLPSIVEGRALVMQEAMSQGLPLIITPNTGGEDLIIEGKTGFLVPIRSPEAIAEKLNWFLDNRSELPDMAAHAITHAASYSWQNYGATIVRKLNEFMMNR